VFLGFFVLKSKLFLQKILRPQECFAFLPDKSAKLISFFAKAKISLQNKANLGKNKANIGLKLGSFWVCLALFFGQLRLRKLT